ncbi:MAG: C-GCAxxG-C-C family protein [Candidatus Thorarchaeota archaeon]
MLSRKETIAKATEWAEAGFLCSEAVLLALSQTLAIKSPIIPKIATGFGAGCGRHGEVCGALSGAIMGLGLRFGRTHPSETPQKSAPYEFSSMMMKLFITRFGYIRCCDLLGIDISCEEGRQAYNDQKLWTTKCRDFIREATGLAYDLLEARASDLTRQ